MSHGCRKKTEATNNLNQTFSEALLHREPFIPREKDFSKIKDSQGGTYLLSEAIVDRKEEQSKDGGVSWGVVTLNTVVNKFVSEASCIFYG